MNAVTHSFTLQLTVSRSGRLGSYIFICFQETGGKFGPKVVKDVERLTDVYKNVVVVPSQSGKMGKQHVKTWYQKCFLPICDGQ